ncbi:hypothetical protein I6N95_04605 [Vagococcus sp. BWB3-3]|uniref:Asp/Glu/hydantoin racemase n=1 Tax=Vagococcus allomyrinae TaxID=2794353 RepID=A0A940SU21_9ENTE|nr:aspartate/glutamate racemase family protein [Vagococcus allomyrinae]MBP1040289.1 hypothetical protein [Vagococcus allomyrinae]
MVKVGLIYTSTTPELIELVQLNIKKELGEGITLLSYQDPTILMEVREKGYVTTQATARLLKLYIQAVEDGAEAILNLCSSVSEVADSAQNLAQYMGIPIVRIDEEMCREATRNASRIGVLATLPTTLLPTKNTLARVGREMGRYPVLVEGLIDGAFGVSQDQFKEMILAKATEIEKEVDLIVLCQGSMAFSEEFLEAQLGVRTLSSPRFGARALKKALINNGRIEA